MRPSNGRQELLDVADLSSLKVGCNGQVLEPCIVQVPARIDPVHGNASDLPVYREQGLQSAALNIPCWLGGKPAHQIEITTHPQQAISTTIQDYGGLTTTCTIPFELLANQSSNTSYVHRSVIACLQTLRHCLDMDSLSEMLGQRGIDVKVTSNIPSGSGLGGSLALQAGLVKGLAKRLNFHNLVSSPKRMVAVANLVGAKLGDMGGFQDPMGVLSSGLAYHFVPKESKSMDLQTMMPSPKVRHTLNRLISERFLVLHSGSEHHSGELLKSIVRGFEKQDATFLANISCGQARLKAAQQIMVALQREGDEHRISYCLDRLAELMAEERENLAAIVPEYYATMYRQINNSKAVKDATDGLHKPLGAGGRGCYLYYVRDDRQKQRLRKLLPSLITLAKQELGIPSRTCPKVWSLTVPGG